MLSHVESWLWDPTGAGVLNPTTRDGATHCKMHVSVLISNLPATQRHSVPAGKPAPSRTFSVDRFATMLAPFSTLLSGGLQTLPPVSAARLQDRGVPAA